MKRVDQAASPRKGYVAPAVEVVDVAIERGFAVTGDLPEFDDGGSAF